MVFAKAGSAVPSDQSTLASSSPSRTATMWSRPIDHRTGLKVPGDGVGSGFEAFAGQFGAQRDDQVDDGLG